MFSALQLATPINSVGGNHAQKERRDRGEASENVPGKFPLYAWYFSYATTSTSTSTSLFYIINDSTVV